VIAALASIPLPSPVPPSVQPLAESLVAAIVIGALGGTEAFAPYLLVPIITCGWTAGAAATLGCVATAWGVLLGTAAVDPAGPNTSQLVMLAATWVPLSTFAGLTAAWASRPGGAGAGGRAGYVTPTGCCRTHVVARQLSLGLDPGALAAALLDDVAAIVRHPSPPCWSAPTATLGRWSAASRWRGRLGIRTPDRQRAIRRHTAGVYVTAIPVRMGSASWPWS
jgi:hypothetical protein